jgi:hypothetical protein
LGCAKCHGESDEHCSDEDHLTPPEFMFSKAMIQPGCMYCHPLLKMFEKEEARVKHRPFLDGTLPDKKYCTDCHGELHKVNHRTRNWDKLTRQLIPLGQTSAPKPVQTEEE